LQIEMKICVFSDIHGNGPAFFAALGDILSEKADVHVFLGDLCGYYYDQLSIYSRLRDIPDLVSLKGNHDELFLRIYGGDEDVRQDYRHRYGNSMERLLQADCREMADWLAGLPVSLAWDDLGTLFCHGSPGEPLAGYIYPDTPLEALAEEAASTIVLGNTHYPMHRKIAGKAIVNPGSLGQPRHGGWSSYAVLDLAVGEVAFREVRYDLSPLYAQIDDFRENNSYLKRVLSRCT